MYSAYRLRMLTLARMSATTASTSIGRSLMNRLGAAATAEVEDESSSSLEKATLGDMDDRRVMLGVTADTGRRADMPPLLARACEGGRGTGGGRAVAGRVGWDMAPEPDQSAGLAEDTRRTSAARVPVLLLAMDVGSACAPRLRLRLIFEPF